MRVSTVILYFQILLAEFFFPRQGYSQNLIFNGNFEDVNYCKEFRQPCSPSAWFYINDNPVGYHKRKEFNSYSNYALLLGVFGVSGNEYWETTLVDKLVPGKEYKLSFDLTAGNNNVDYYGFLFTDSLIFSACDTFLTPTNYIKMSGGVVKLLKSGWIHIEKWFIADRPAQCMIVGKFGNSRSTIISSGFAFDNLVIQPVKSYSIINKSSHDSIYAITHRHEYQKLCDNKAAPKPLLPVKKNTGIDSLFFEDIQFEFNKYDILNPEVFEKFKNKFNPEKIKRIEIFGYTDSMGSEKYNLNLSQLRADAVKGLLIKQYSIPESMIIATGKGISKEYTDHTRNRRVEILVFSKID